MYELFSLDECQRKLNLKRQDIPMHSSVSSEFDIELSKCFFTIIIYMENIILDILYRIIIKKNNILINDNYCEIKN